MVEISLVRIKGLDWDSWICLVIGQGSPMDIGLGSS